MGGTQARSKWRGDNTASRARCRKVTLLIPCHNEAESIGRVISSVPRSRLREAGYSIEVLVIDNASTDATAEVAKAHGARVIHEPKKG